VTVSVPVVRPDLGDEEVEAATRVLRSGWIMQGPEVAAFEAELAAFLSAGHVVAVSSCTSALELALRVLGVGPGDDVITVSHSFIATANAVLATGARPVFVDVEPDNYGMDPRQAAAAITPETRAILAVHQLGFPCDLAPLLELGLPVVEDAACALGSELDGVRLGRPHGVIACFSFHPRKVVATGDGGALATADPQLATRLRWLRQHGQEGEHFVEPGWNHRMTDLQAAIGRTQLRRLPAALTERRRLAARFAAALARSPVLAPPSERPGVRTNWQSYPARLRPGAPRSQAEVMAHFAARGVATRGGITNAHEEPAYAGTSRFFVGPGGLGASERLRRETVLLPLYHGMTAAEEDAVVSAIDGLA
jgi:perosamine synthetase